jgi:hypothetical protein
MSEFKTIIPFNLEAVLKQLPPGSELLAARAVRLTPDNNVEVVWYNEGIRTNATRPVEFSLDALTGKAELPSEIIDSEVPLPASETARVPNETVAAKRKSKAQVTE